MPKLRNGNNGDSNPGSLDCESGILPTEVLHLYSDMFNVLLLQVYCDRIMIFVMIKYVHQNIILYLSRHLFKPTRDVTV